jgi:hypothetical protein
MRVQKREKEAGGAGGSLKPAGACGVKRRGNGGPWRGVMRGRRGRGLGPDRRGTAR